MSRTLKKTRIKWLPPKVQLRDDDALTGSFPTHPRIVSDNRTGVFRTFFNDQKTVLFRDYEGTSGYMTTSIGPGFNPCAISGSYLNYNLGPSIEDGGNIYLWWPCEEVITSGSLISGSNSYLIDSGSGNHKGRIWNPLSGVAIQDVPPYYSNITSTYPNSSSFYQFTVTNGDNTVVSPILSGALVDSSGSTSFTLSVHVNFDSLQDFNPILWRGNRSTGFSDWELLVKANGALEFAVFNSTTGDYRVYTGSPGLITTSTWHHVLVGFSLSGFMKFYVDGVSETPSISTDTGWTNLSNSDNQLYLGGLFDLDYVSGSRVSLGAFDNVVIANRVATVNEINFLRLGGAFPGEPQAVHGIGLAMPSGLHTSNPALYRFDQTGSMVRNAELLTDIAVSGAIRKGVGDSFVTFTPGQDFQAFQDEGNPAVDGLSLANSFYATGSRVADVGEGFSQPLWSKTKVEIDLTPSVSHSFFIQNYTSSSNNYTMAYWNTSRHVWEGIGAGKEFGRYTVGSQSSFQSLCEEQCIGFGTGISQGGSGLLDFSLGAKVSNYGFPYHVKYHATSSNLIAMSDYITSPFLLEKIVLEWSGSLVFNSTSFGTVTSYTCCTFFILNQRKPYGFNDPGVQSFVYQTADGRTHTLVTGALIPSSYNSGLEYNTIRELVTYAQVVGFNVSSSNTQVQRGSRELNLRPGTGEVQMDNFGAWSGRLIMSGVVKNALPNAGLEAVLTGHNDSGTSGMMLINKNSTRSGLFTPGGRDFIGALEKGQVLQTLDVLQSGFPSFPDPTGSVVILDRYSKPNPYLLQPTDQLVFGWQLPVANRLNSAFGIPQYDGKGTEMTFAPVPSKITLYGSMISEGHETHDTLNQLLSSTSVHEVIG